jgi:putative alpha-1,2-mannosidase
VHPFVGTQNFGNTFPGASAPFGMVQVSPDTGGQGGYDYQQSTIYGFSQTHLSGVGCGVAGELPIMPTTGAVDSVDPNAYRSAYSHDDEEATPGYYRVGLSKYGVERRADRHRAHRLAAVHLPGHRRGERPVQHRQGQPERVRLRDPRRRRPDGRGPGARRRLLRRQGRHTVYFTATFDRPVRLLRHLARLDTQPGSGDAAGTAATAPGSPSTRPTTGTSSSRSACPTPASTAPGRTSPPRPATRTTSTPPAPRCAPPGRHSSTRSRSAAGPAERQKAFYTALYHSLLHPNLAGDVDGRTVGFDGAVHTADGYTPYQNFSLWDTYRPQNQLLELLEPQGRPGRRAVGRRDRRTAGGCRGGRWPTARPTS